MYGEGKVPLANPALSLVFRIQLIILKSQTSLSLLNIFLFMSLEEYPNWIRGIDAFIGLITVLVGAWILFSPDLVEGTLVITVAIGLFLIGVVRFGKGISMSGLTMSSRAMKIISGIGSIAISLLSFVFSSLTVTFLITLLTFAIMIVGLSRMVVGNGEKTMPGWMRLLNIVGGGIVFFFGFFAAIFTDMGFFTLRIILACVFIALGVIRIAGASKGEVT